MRKTLIQTRSVGEAVQLCQHLEKKFLEEFGKSPKIELLVFMSTHCGITIQWRTGEEKEVEWFEERVLTK